MESRCVFAVIIDHIVISDPLHLTTLTITQLAVYWRSPPVSRGLGGTLINADWSIPLASPCPKMAESGYKGCTIPIDFNKPTSSCPVISIPYAGVNSHPLFVGVSYSFILIVPENSNWYAINVPPETMMIDSCLRKCSATGIIWEWGTIWEKTVRMSRIMVVIVADRFD